jgi:hypothetical protein
MRVIMQLLSEIGSIEFRSGSRLCGPLEAEVQDRVPQKT